MKKSIILGAVITSFILSSCSLFKTYSSTAKEVDVYLLDYATAGNKKIEECKLGTISPQFIDGEGYVPYFSLEQYASLYKPYFEADVKSEVENNGFASTWTIYRGEELYFYATISSLTKTVMTAGSISNVLTSDSNPSDYSVISKYTKFEDSYERLGEYNYATYYFGSYDFKTFSKNNRRYYPLGLLENDFSESSNIFHFYNYKNIYATWDVENYSKKFKTGGSFNNETSVDREMENITQGQTIPSYLLDYNLSCFLFVLDNFYGLKSYYKINSMKDYLSKYAFYSDINSKDGSKRGVAYASCLGVFDDHHTGLVSVNDAWGEGGTRAIGGNRVIKRQYQDQELTKLRKKSFPENRYYTISSDLKTALFYFDSFDLGTSEQVFNTNGTVKTTAGQYDSFYNVLQHLQLFKREGIENVIIDVSTNGGGVIGVMAKILALISKDNKGTVSMMDETMEVVNTTVCSVDVNMDGKYTADEVFGNDFNICVMCSDCSFSCGNAFPCYAQKMGIKVIGEKSGGGECAVGIHYMPNSEYVYHSSMTHLGYFDQTNKKFTGFESGATPDISLLLSGKTAFSEYNADKIVCNIPSDLYDVDSLSAKLA